jgi:hypothetical protein
VLTSTWDGPNIAHLLVSFGFADGPHLIFSVEIRREASKEFSQWGDFFCHVRQVLIAADEADIVRLRTNVHGEDVPFYRLDMDPNLRRQMFLAYLDLGNRFAE